MTAAGLVEFDVNPDRLNPQAEADIPVARVKCGREGRLRQHHPTRDNVMQKLIEQIVPAWLGMDLAAGRRAVWQRICFGTRGSAA